MADKKKLSPEGAIGLKAEASVVRIGGEKAEGWKKAHGAEEEDCELLQTEGAEETTPGIGTGRDTIMAYKLAATNATEATDGRPDKVARRSLRPSL